MDVRDVWGTGPDDVWIAARFGGPAAEDAGAYHWDGSVLTEHRDFFEVLGVEEVQEGVPGARVASLDAAAGALWMVGDEPEGANAASLQVWRLVDGGLVRTIDESEVRETPSGPLLPALYETPAGTVRALGEGGLVLDHSGE